MTLATYNSRKRIRIPDPSFNIKLPRRIYVHAEGEDHWDGLSPDSAVKTITKAATRVSEKISGAASESNRWNIEVLGEYDGTGQTIVLPEFVSLFGPGAQVDELNVEDGVIVDIDRLICKTGSNVVKNTAASSVAMTHVRFRYVEHAVNGFAFENASSGRMLVDVDHFYMAPGSDSGTGMVLNGPTFVRIGRAQLRSAGSLLDSSGPAATDAVVANILFAEENGAFTTTLLENTSTAAPLSATVCYSDVDTLLSDVASSVTNLVTHTLGARNNTVTTNGTVQHLDVSAQTIP